MSEREGTRREFLIKTSAAVGAGLVLSSCGRREGAAERERAEEVTANEDLMREHGVLRRILLIYAEAAPRLRRDPSSVPPDALQKAAHLFRSFGEDYHEKALEEQYVFPMIKGRNGPAASYPDILIVQHNRGREITDYIISVTRGIKLGTAQAETLAGVLEGFVKMYEHHSAREDTVVFPAWKALLPEGQLEELAEKFEEIEHQRFGSDGFDDAVKQVSEIEAALGLSDLAQFTPPSPPSVK